MTSARIKRAPAQPDMAKPVLFIGTPCYGCMATTPYIASLRNLTRSLDKSGIAHTVELMGNESLITRARNKLVAAFLKTNATHLVFIDADVGFNPNDLACMVRANYDVCVGAYPMKAIGWGNVEQAVRDGAKPENLAKLGGLYAVNPYVADMATGRLDVQEREGGKFVRVEDGATGFMVIKREAIERFIAHYRASIEYVSDYEPVGETHWKVFQADTDPASERQRLVQALIDEAVFACPGDDSLDQLDERIIVAAKKLRACKAKPGRYLSEDYWFCRMWQMMGGEVYLNIGAQLTHTGTYRFEGDVGLLFEVDDEETSAAGLPGTEPLAGGGSAEEPAHALARKVAAESYESGRPPESTPSIPPVIDPRYASLPVTFVDP